MRPGNRKGKEGRGREEREKERGRAVSAETSELNGVFFVTRYNLGTLIVSYEILDVVKQRQGQYL